MNSPAAEMIVRRMKAADVDDVLALAASLNEAPHWPRAAYLAALESVSQPASTPQRIALVAVHAAAGSIAGFAVASLVPSLVRGEAELETIAVSAPWQRQGVGRQLWAAVARELRLAEVQVVRLEVRASNLPALALYRAVGFAETGRRPRYYADPVEDAVLMDLRLG